MSSFLTISIFQNQKLYSDNKFGESESNDPRVAAQETLTAVWLENPTFEDPIEPVWYPELEGDLNDLESTAGLGQLNMKVIGDSRVMRIDEAISNTDWSPYKNPDLLIFPDTYTINSEGCYVSHLWDEDINQTRNRPSVHWKRVITMPVNMSDYKITSASLEVIFNASVSVSPHAGSGGGIDREGDAGLDVYSSGDSADFYALLNDGDETLNPIPIASNNSGLGNLGQDSPAIGSFPDSKMDTIPESVLKDALTSVLSSDGFNFTITLGIDIYCEDNEIGVDVDRWNSLIIRSFNLTFSYEKKIQEFSSISWNQDSGQISDVSNDTVILNEARLNFKYRIDNNWTSSSTNSEIRAYINTNKIPESIKLEDATTSFQEAKTGGFDVTSLIPYNTDINFSIQVYIGDDFSLDRNRTISIDDLYLNITYTVIFPDFQTNLQIFFNGVNKTSNPIYDHPVGNDLNITVKYPDSSGNHIPGAVVQLSGNITGTLTEDPANEQYTIIIDANELNVGTYNFKVVAHKINFELSTINPILNIIPTETQDLQLFLNGEDKSLDPLITVPLDGLINITVKYTTLLGAPITGATIILIGDGLLEPLNESIKYHQYSVILNSSIKLSFGINLLKIEANKLNFEDRIIYPRITVRKIISLITGVNKTNSISIYPGEDVNIQVYINNTDFNEIIKGAFVTYTWEGGVEGLFQDLDNDGIYEANLTDIPAGSHTLTINAIGSDKYNFISLEFVIVASKPGAASPLFLILLIVGIIVSIGLGGYLYVYQKVLKYPKTVRKVRKFRKSLKRKKAPQISIDGREKAFNSAYKHELHKTIRFLKLKPKREKESQEKPIKESLQNLKPDTIMEPKNQNLNVYQKEHVNKTKIRKSDIFKKQFKLKLRKFWYGTSRLKKGRIIYPLVILTIIILYSLLIPHIFSQNIFNISDTSLDTFTNDNLGIAGQASFTKQWLNNTSFDAPIEPTWYPIYGNLGDPSDVIALPDIGQVNYTVLGDSGIKRIDDTFNDVDWTAFNNPIYPIAPDVYGVNSSGCYVAHIWNENIDQSRNTPSMQWKRNITMPVNMSDYIITSASVEVIFNASVQALDHDGGGIEVKGDYTEGNPPTVPQFGIGDSATFYAQISDLDNSFPYPIASNKTTKLGQDSPVIDSYPDTPMNSISEDLLKSYLTSVLSSDGYNFTITVGIDIYCEDNEYNVDIDNWRRLIIRSFNLTFSYERKIDQFTSVSWNQNADKISDISNNTVIVNEALLKFKYKVDQNWPTSASNSELRILFNDNQHPETVKLSTATTSFQQAKIGGFDVTSLITDDVNLSIQVFLSDDEFSLDKNITISIDDVTLNISYTIIFPDKETDLHLFLNSVNKTDDPDFDIFIGESLNITIKYLNKTGMHITNATVQLIGNFTADLEENSTLGQYTTIIDTDTSDAGINFLTIVAQAEDYQTQVIDLIVRIDKFPTENLHVILNNQNVTQDPFIELTVGKILNVTLKYNLLNGSHIPGATILLSSQTFTSYINESIIFEQYSILIDTNQSLKIGPNLLTVTAQTESFQTKAVDITVSVKKINVKIEPYSGTNTIQTKTGSDVLVRIRLNNTDFGGYIKGDKAFVRYNWEGIVGILEDLNNDGIYEATMPDVSEGTSSLEISVFIGDKYFVEDYLFIIAATSEIVPENPILPALFAVSMIVIGGLAIYLYAYQVFLKYPKQVRKVRKFRKSLRRASAPKIPVIGRESSFKIVYNNNLGKFTSDLKLKRHPGTIKPKIKKLAPDELPEKSLEDGKEQSQLIEKSIEKKEELDNLIKDTSKETK
ncbi:MAG: hypothetical protein ACFFDY_04665 [Candidatus Thorarchaeota archaeon]